MMRESKIHVIELSKHLLLSAARGNQRQQLRQGHHLERNSTGVFPLSQCLLDSPGLLAKHGKHRDLEASCLDEPLEHGLVNVVVDVRAERLQNAVPTPAAADVKPSQTETAGSGRVEVVAAGQAWPLQTWKTPREVIRREPMAGTVGQAAELQHGQGPQLGRFRQEAAPLLGQTATLRAGGLQVPILGAVVQGGGADQRLPLAIPQDVFDLAEARCRELGQAFERGEDGQPIPGQVIQDGLG